MENDNTKFDEHEDEAADNWEEYWKSELPEKSIFVDKVADSVSNFFKRSGSTRLLHDVVTSELDDADKNILEAGCGRAETALKLAKNGRNVFLVDTSMAALENATKHIKSGSLSAFPIRASIFQMPFKDDTFDLVFNAGVVDHFKTEGRKTAVSEMMRVTTEDGKTLIGVSDERSIIHDRAMDYAIKKKRWRFGFKQSFYTLRDLFEEEENDIKVREYSCGYVSQFEFLYHYIPPKLIYQKLFFWLFYIISCPFKFLNNLPGHLLIAVLERKSKFIRQQTSLETPPVHDNSLYRRKVIRPLAKRISPAFEKRNFSGNGIGWLKLAFGLLGAGLLASKSVIICLVGMLFIQLNFLLDAVDGEVARLKDQAGKLSGEYWDKLTDLLPKTAMYFLWGFGTFRLTGSYVPLFCGAFFAIWNIYPRYCGLETMLERIDKLPAVYDKEEFHTAVKNSFSVGKNRGISDFYLTILVHPAMNVLTIFFIIEIFKPEFRFAGTPVYTQIYTRYLLLLIFTFIGAINFLRKGVRFFRLLDFE